MFYPLCTEVWSNIIFNWVTWEERCEWWLPSRQFVLTEDSLQLVEHGAAALALQIRSSFRMEGGLLRHLYYQESTVQACLFPVALVRPRPALSSSPSWAASSVKSNAALCCAQTPSGCRRWWNGSTTMWHEELLGCRMASKLVSVKCMRDAALWACWAHRLFRGCVKYARMNLHICVICLHVFHKSFSTEAAASWPDPLEGQTVRVWVCAKLSLPKMCRVSLTLWLNTGENEPSEMPKYDSQVRA